MTPVATSALTCGMSDSGLYSFELRCRPCVVRWVPGRYASSAVESMSRSCGRVRVRHWRAASEIQVLGQVDLVLDLLLDLLQNVLQNLRGFRPQKLFRGVACPRGP